MTDSRRRRPWHVPALLLLLCCALLPRAHAGLAPPYPLIDTTAPASLGLFLSWTLDADGSLDLEAATRLPPEAFHVPEQETLWFGYTRATLWVRVALQNPNDRTESLVLEVPHAGLSRLDFFRPLPDGTYAVVHSGTSSERVIGDHASRHYLFDVTVPPASTRVYWFRVQADQALGFSLHVLPHDLLAGEHDARQSGIALLFGLLLGLALFNLAAWVLTRRAAWGWYLLYLVAVTGFVAAQAGYIGVLYLRGSGTQWQVEVACALVATIASLEFGRTLLDTRHLQPVLHGWLNYLLAAALVCLGAQALLETHALGPMYTTLAALVMGATLAAGSIALRAGNPDATTFLAARLCSALFGGWAVLAGLGVAPPLLPVTLLLLAGAVTESLLAGITLYRQQQRRDNAAAGAMLEQAVASAETRARSEFLSRFSHEVRTPLNGILGMTELLVESPLAPRQREYVATIRASGEALLLLVNDALDWARLEAGRLELAHTDFDLAQVVADSLEPVQLRAEEKNLELVMDVEPTLPPRVTGDPARLRQVLCNLLTNAVRYTNRGEVHVHVLPDGNGDRIRFQVSDTGIGIPRERLAGLFEGRQEDLQRQGEQPAGRGFGLLIARQLVERMGGSIGVHSEEHRGSTFWFTLPLPAAQGEAPAADLAILHGKRLLVVDDNAAMRRVLEQQAGSWRMEVSTADNGQEALAMARTQSNLGTPFDVAIVDHNMPGMSGLQLSARIKEDPLVRHDMLIIMLTGLNIAPTEPMARNVGIRRVLTKPVTGRTLQAVLVEEFDRRRRQGSSDGTEAAPPLGGSLRVLVVEDHHLSQKVIRGMLNKLGVRSDVVNNGQEAFEAVQHHRYDLVLMDCEMPLVDGYEATRRIRAWERDNNRARTPVIALSAYIMNDVKERCRQAGMDAHLPKPLDLSELREALRAYCGAA